MHYSEMFKDKMIRKMTGINAVSAAELSRDVDVAQSTLSRWLRNAGIDSKNRETILMTDSKKSRRPQDRNPEEKLKIIIGAEKLGTEELGIFLREQGLYETHLEQWRMQMLESLQNGIAKPKKEKRNQADAKKIKTLEKELRRKDKALAETAALLVLKKKVQQIWGDEDDSIND
jgi:DNA-binding transcriptional ArsR family regulator